MVNLFCIHIVMNYVCLLHLHCWLCPQNEVDSKETECLVVFLVLGTIPLADITCLFAIWVLYKKKKKSELKKIKKQVRKPPSITKALCLILPLN